MTKVSEIMTKDLFTVSEDTPLKEVSNVFKRTNVRHLPVVSGTELKGIVSHTDILRMSFGSHFGDNETDADEAIFEMLNLSQVMVNSPVTVNETESIASVAKMLTEREFHALPVLDDGKLVGIVTTTDIIKYLLENQAE